MISTKVGLVPREKLTIIDEVKEEGNARTIITKWFYGESLVRQDAWVNILNGAQSEVTGDLNG